MANHLGFVFSDRPIEALEDDLIWGSNIAVRSFVKDVASRLASPLGSDSPMLDTNSLAFAVHGRWGAGKSSLIKLTIARAREIARGYGRDSDLLACWYNASAAENTRSRARGSLGLQILMTLASAAIDPEGRRDVNPYREVVRLFSRYFNGGANAPGEHAGLSLDDPQKMREYLSHLERSVAALPDFDTLLQREINGTGMIDHQGKVVTVIIDDLDRCSRQFITELLEAMNFLSNVSNLFFIVAIDRDVLRKSVRETYERRNLSGADDPDIALEKYVQYTFEIPPVTDAVVDQYIKQLLRGADEEAMRHIAAHSDIIARGIRVKTPRGIKRCINTIRPSLALQLNERGLTQANEGGATEGAQEGGMTMSLPRSQQATDTSNEQIRRIIKELVFEYAWRDFHMTYLQPALGDWNAFSLVFTGLELVCANYEDDGDREQFDFSLKRIQSQLAAGETLDVPTGLSRLLAAKPWFFLTEKDRERGLKRLLAGLRPLSTSEAPEGSETLVPDLAALTQEPPIRKVERLHREARIARTAGDHEKLVRLIAEAATLARENPQGFTPAEVVDFGNLALYAEGLAMQFNNPGVQELSLFLYQFAFNLNQQHLNNRLNFISFILDARNPKLAQLYDAVDQLLGDSIDIYDAENYGMRWLRYRAQLAQLRDDTETGLTYVQQIVDRLAQNPERSAFDNVVGFFSGRYSGNLDRSLLRRAARMYIPQVEGQEKNRALLVYADALGAQTAHDEERLEIYKYVVRPIEEGGIEDTAQVPFRGNALHNYAVDLKRSNYLAEAGQRWFESYQLIGQTDRDGNLKSSYSTYLTQDCNNPQAAQIVSSAGALTEPVIAPGGRPTPDEFYAGGMLALGLL